jgi:hypothetical protein
MKKTTTAALLLLGSLLFIFLFVANQGIKTHEHELSLASEMTRDLASALAPDTRVKLLRERGSDKAIVTDREQFVLLLNATPSTETWRDDPSGRTVARRLAERAHGRYGPDRPIQFIEVVLVLPDGEKVRYGFREDRDGHLQGFEVPPLPKP